MKLVFEDDNIEVLEEMATIYKSKEYGILVAVNPDSHRTGNPYFKFFNSHDFFKATKVIRILFNEPDYVVHKDGKELWNLNSKDKKLLIKILNQKSKHYPSYTNWQVSKFDWNSEYLEEMLNIDEYYNGEYDDIYKDDPGYIPSTLEMPDYMNLVI